MITRIKLSTWGMGGGGGSKADGGGRLWGVCKGGRPYGCHRVISVLTFFFNSVHIKDFPNLSFFEAFEFKYFL